MKDRDNLDVYAGNKLILDSDKRAAVIMIIGLACSVVMALIDGVIAVNFIVKSVARMLLFIGCPLVYVCLDKETEIKKFLKLRLKNIIIPAMLGVISFCIIAGAYFSFNKFLDFSFIADAFIKNAGVSVDKFIFGALYISISNSIAEEFFFRGFLFFSLKRNVSRKFAYVFSAAAYTAYHSATITGLFAIELFLILMIGLVAESIILNFLDDINESIYPSWIIHVLSNLAVYVVGLSLLGII